MENLPIPEMRGLLQRAINRLTAAPRLSRQVFCSKDGDDSAECYCTVGSLLDHVAVSPTYMDIDNLRDGAQRATAEVVGLLWGLLPELDRTACCGEVDDQLCDLYSWNDQSRRTKEEVLDLLQRGLAQLDATTTQE